MAETKKPAKRPAAAKSGGFSDEERAAMKERAAELKAARRKGGAESESDVLAKIAELKGAERAMAERLHTVIKAAAAGLSPRLWYGSPAYYNADGKNVCFFQSASKFKTRYATLGFNEAATLDDGAFWPTAFALLELTPAVEARITALVKKATG